MDASSWKPLLRNMPGREEKPGDRPPKKGQEGCHPTASNPNARLVQLAAFKPKEAWQALHAPVGKHLQAMIRWRGPGAAPISVLRTNTPSTLAEVGRAGEPRREPEIDEGEVLHECDPGLVPLGQRCLEGFRPGQSRPDCLQDAGLSAACSNGVQSRRRLFDDGNASGW